MGVIPQDMSPGRKIFDQSCGYETSNKTNLDKKLACEGATIAKIENKTNFKEECNCYWPCNDSTYSVTMSHSLWPDRKVVDSFIETKIENHPIRQNLKAFQYYQKLKSLNATKDEIYAWVTSHFLRLNIFASSDIVSVKEQIPMYTSY